MKKQKGRASVLGKDGQRFLVEGDRLGCFLVHQIPGDSKYWVLTHYASGIAIVQSIKGVLRARKMAAALLSHDLSADFRAAGTTDEIMAALNPQLFQIIKEFNNKAANTQYDPSVQERKAIQTTIFEVLNEPVNRQD